MRAHFLALSGTILVVVLSLSFVAAEDATIDIAALDVAASDTLITITSALPEDAVGKRIDSAVLEVPLSVASEDSVYMRFPLVEVRQNGSDVPKQTILLVAGFDGVARLDVTRFVRTWENTEEHEFLVGALSLSNGTRFELEAVEAWTEGTAARLLVNYSTLAGESASSLE